MRIMAMLGKLLSMSKYCRSIWPSLVDREHVAMSFYRVHVEAGGKDASF
jgi:hypothetical protein